MKDKISVIIPCYNVEKYVMRCFQSIYAQTYGFEHLEVIFIDDLSTDHTYTIIESLQKRYPDNVFSLKLSKKGMEGGARNLGMDVSSGKYIIFLDADDCMDSKMLEQLWNKMTEEGYDIVQCGAMVFRENVPEFQDEEEKNEIYDLKDFQQRKKLILKCTGGFYMCAWGKMYRRKFLENNKIRFIEQAYFVDNHFSILCALLANKYCYTNQKLLYYYENDGGITKSDLSLTKIRDLVKVAERLKSEITQRNLQDLCPDEVQTFVIWKSYFEAMNRLEAVVNREKEYYKGAILKLYDKNSILHNPYIAGIGEEQVLRIIEYLRE